MHFGNDLYGVCTSSLNTEILHAAKNGFILHFLGDTFQRKFKARTCRYLDHLVGWLASLPRHSGEKQFGRLRFPDGITSITNTTADCKYHILQAFLMVLLTKEGRGRMVSKYQLQGWKDLVEGVELMLIFVAWASKDLYWRSDDPNGEQEAAEALKQMMRGLRNLTPRLKGQGWDISKSPPPCGNG